MSLKPIIFLHRLVVLSQKQKRETEYLHPLRRSDRTEVCLFDDAVNFRIYIWLVEEELSMNTEHYWNDSDRESGSTLRKTYPSVILSNKSHVNCHGIESWPPC